jgi:hypothetical protein
MPKIDDGAYVQARFYAAYGAALAAGTNAASLRAALPSLRGSLDSMRKHYAGERDFKQDLQFWGVMAEEASALAMASGGNAEGTIAALRTAAEHETIIPTEFGPPAVPKPPYELLGDVLRQHGRLQEAADAYRAALVRNPGRTQSLQGLLACQNALGNAAQSTSIRATLARYVH